MLLKDGLEGVARTVLLADDLGQLEQLANRRVGAHRLDHLGPRELAVIVLVYQMEGRSYVRQLFGISVRHAS